MIYGFDSRYTRTIPFDGRFVFACIKISEAVRGGPYEEPVLQWRLAGDRGMARLPFHFWRCPQRGDPVEDGIEQAEWMRSIYEQHFLLNGYAELPPAIDCEDIYSPRGERPILSMLACLHRTRELWDKDPLIYSAGWWWDYRIKPYTMPTHELYSYDLWEADPPPDTLIGYFGEPVIRQIRLDHYEEGFSAKIDTNTMIESYWRKHIEPEGPSIRSRLEKIADELQKVIGEIEE